MFQNISVLSFLIYAAAVGFATAIIFFNMQRSALSKFINALVQNKCTSKESALSLKELSLSPLESVICKSAFKNQFGLKRAVDAVTVESNGKEQIENVFDDKNDDKYFLKDDVDFDTLLKKYTYNKMPAKLLILLVTALIILVFICAFAVDFLVSYVTTPRMKDTSKESGKENEISETVDKSSDESTSQNSNEDTDKSNNSNEDSATSPRIPV